MLSLGILIVCKDDLVGFSWEFLRENYPVSCVFFFQVTDAKHSSVLTL